MRKRERLEHAFAGEPVDRPPVALWRHFPGDDQRALDFARATLEFQAQFDWDFIKFCPPSSYCTADLGLQDAWEGAPDGTRAVRRRPITRPLDWTDLRPLDPQRGELARHFEALERIVRVTGEDTPVLATIFSPLGQARNLAGEEALRLHLRTDPERLRTGLNVLTENVFRIIERLRQLPIAGIFYAIRHASYAQLSEEEYASFGLSSDERILDSLPRTWWFNMVHLHGEKPMFRFLARLRCQAVNWHDRETEPDLAMGKTLFDGAVCGGLARTEHVLLGTPALIRDTVRDAIHSTGGRRLILSTGCVAHITTPLSHLRAVRESVENA